MKVGDTLAGRYELRTRLGGGGLGEVFRGLDARTRREVTIKIFDPARCPPAKLLQVQATLTAAMGVSHPAVALPRVQIALSMKPPFVVSDALEGHDLAAELVDGPIPWGRALEIVTACADALTALASETDASHRALKPGNVWICPDGQVRLLDFGTAELGAQPATPRADGTAAEYRAPEQIEGEPGDARSDVFSLGALLFELTTGVPAFAGATPAEAATEALAPSAPRPSEVAPSISLPPTLAALIARMLARDPDDRPDDAAALGRELLAVRRAAESAARAPAAPAPAIPPLPAPTHSDDPTTALSIPVMRRMRAAPVSQSPAPLPEQASERAPVPVEASRPDEPPVMAIASAAPVSARSPAKKHPGDSWLAAPPVAREAPPQKVPAHNNWPASPRRQPRSFVPDERTEVLPQVERHTHVADGPTEAVQGSARHPSAPASQTERTEVLATAVPRRSLASSVRPRAMGEPSAHEEDGRTEVLLMPSRHEPERAARRPLPTPDDSTRVTSGLHRVLPSEQAPEGRMTAQTSSATRNREGRVSMRMVVGGAALLIAAVVLLVLSLV
jgi:serine/threonine protein kinase